MATGLFGRACTYFVQALFRADEFQQDVLSFSIDKVSEVKLAFT
jgi:hypothetical protein